MKPFLYLLLSLFVVASSHEVLALDDNFNPDREWTSADGKSTFKGKVTKYDGEKVTINPKGKATVTTTKDKFSAEDIAWLDEHQQLIGKSAKEVEALSTSLIAKKLSTLNAANEAKLKKNAKYYILLFSASWCPPCRAEAPHIVKQYNSDISQNKDVELVLMSADNDSQALSAWIEKEQMPYPVYLDGSKYNSIPGVEGNRAGFVPSVIIVDGKGNVVARNSREGILDGEKKVIGQGGAGALIKNYKTYCK